MSDPFPPPRHALPGQQQPYAAQQPPHPAQQVQPYPQQPMVVMAPATPTSGTAVFALVAGLGSFVTCGLSGVLAIIFGHAAMKETKTGRRGGHGMAVAGLVLGYVTAIPWLLFFVMMLLGVVAAPFGALLPAPTAP